VNIPKWNARNLQIHYQKHPAGEDKQCWMDCLNKSSIVACNEYEAKSIDVVLNPEWTAKLLNRDTSDSRKHFVDKLGIRSITSSDGEMLITCYHVHDHNREHYNPNIIPPLQVQRIIENRLRQERLHVAGGSNMSSAWR
jgi:hypothetical protein